MASRLFYVRVANPADGGSRFYAPGFGLVREEWSGETYNTVLSLAHWKLPKA